MKKKILVIEDDDMLRNALSEALQRDFEMMVASNGEEGLKDIIEFKPNLVVLDMLLPGMGGFEILEKVRKHPDAEVANTHVLIFSNLNSANDIIKAKSLLVDGYIVKGTTNIKELVNRIEADLK